MKRTTKWRGILGAAAAVTFASIGHGGDAAETKRTHQLQLGIGVAAPYNIEEPFINMAQARGAGWSFEPRGGKRIDGKDAIAAGYIDPVTLLPTAKASEMRFGEIAAFFSEADQFPDYYADDYVLSWKGNARGYIQRWEGGVPSKRTNNSVTYTLNPSQVTRGTMRFAITGEGLSDIRFYRKKYESLLERGEIWNPDFIDYVKRYDIVRTMDLQFTNNLPVRRFDQIATMSEPWGNRSALAWPEMPFSSIPFEVLFNLGVKADVAVWITLPLQLGSPVGQGDPAFRRADKPERIDTGKFRAAVSKRAAEVLSSSEWDVFAKEFVDRYLASGYPLTRPLYVEPGNEVWNNASGFGISTNYAVAIAEGAASKPNVGQGYGILVGRYMIALEKEFARRKISPNIVYVVASHTSNTWRTQQALQGLTEYLTKSGVNSKSYLAKTAVAVTNYYGHFNEMSAAMFGSKNPVEYAPKWIAEAERDPKGLASRVSTMLASGPSNVKATGPWILARFAEHKAIAEKAGSRFLGAYEGGSHLTLPKELRTSSAFQAWWMTYLWSEQNAAVNRKINNDLIKAFPGIVLSNYKAIGTLTATAPWNDGHYARSTPMMEMWDEFARQDRID